MKTKICNKCKTEKILSQFNKGNDNDKLEYRCKLCVKEYHKKYYQIHKQEKKEKSRNYHQEHKEEIKRKHKIYYQKNKNKIKNQAKKYRIEHKKERAEHHIKYMKVKLKIDINFRLSHYLRVRLNLALKGNPKLSTTMKLVGCSIEKLKKYLEKQFTEGMTWSNYGKWHIDHIRPCASFDLSKPKEQRKCFHYKNLQPLWAEDNLKKG